MDMSDTNYKGVENMSDEELDQFYLEDHPEGSLAWEDWYGCTTFGTQEYIDMIHNNHFRLSSPIQ